MVFLKGVLSGSSGIYTIVVIIGLVVVVVPCCYRVFSPINQEKLIAPGEVTRSARIGRANC